MTECQDLKDILKSNLNTGGHKSRAVSEAVLCMIHSMSVCYEKIALAASGSTKIESKCKAIHRLIKNFNIENDAVSKFLFSRFSGRKKNLKAAVDRTNWKFGKKDTDVFMLSLSCRKIAFPTAWLMLSNNGGASNSDSRTDLIRRFVDLFGAECIGCVIGDREFASKEFIEQLVSSNTDFRLRAESSTKIEKKNGGRTDAENISGLEKRAGSRIAVERRNILGENILVSGKKLINGKMPAVVSGRKNENAIDGCIERWNIETMFKSSESSGFSIEGSHSGYLDRTGSPVSLVSISFAWPCLVGIAKSKIEKIETEKYGRKAKSSFRVGFDEIGQIKLGMPKNDKKYKRTVPVLTYG